MNYCFKKERILIKLINQDIKNDNKVFVNDILIKIDEIQEKKIFRIRIRK